MKIAELKKSLHGIKNESDMEELSKGNSRTVISTLLFTIIAVFLADLTFAPPKFSGPLIAITLDIP